MKVTSPGPNGFKNLSLSLLLKQFSNISINHTFHKEKEWLYLRHQRNLFIWHLFLFFKRFLRAKFLFATLQLLLLAFALLNRWFYLWLHIQDQRPVDITSLSNYIDKILIYIIFLKAQRRLHVIRCTHFLARIFIET